MMLPPQEQRGLGQPAGLLSLPDKRGAEGSSMGSGQGLDPRASEIARVGLALAAVLGLLLLTRVIVRRVAGPLAGGGRPSGVLEVLARYPVARAQQLVLLKLSGRVVLLHQTKTAMTTLSEVSDPDEVAALLARIEAGGRTAAAAGLPSLVGRLLARRAGGTEAFAQALGRQAHLDDAVVVDLTRRPRRRRGVAR